MTRRTTVGAVVVIALAAVLAAGHRAEARRPVPTPHPVVGGLGGMHLGLNQDGDMIYETLGSDDYVPSNATAFAATVTTEDPDDPRDGMTMTVYAENYAEGMAPPNAVEITIIPGSLTVGIFNDGTIGVSYSYLDACGNRHNVTIFYYADGDVWLSIDGNVGRIWPW